MINETKRQSVLLIFTGGTISMGESQSSHSLAPLDTEKVLSFLPELGMMNVDIQSVAFSPLIDSSDITPDNWVKIAEIIETYYNRCDGFVVLHGTDTMAYSASALSFMLKNLNKPVIFTGSQLPVGVLRSDAKENLITAIELAAAMKSPEEAMVPEVCLFFEDKLMRGNRTTKRNAEDFNAFASFNVREDLLDGLKVGDTFTAFCPAFNKEVQLKVTYIKDQGTYAVWKATKSNGQYDLKTFEVKAVPVNAFDGLRPGMSLIVKKDK